MRRCCTKPWGCGSHSDNDDSGTGTHRVAGVVRASRCLLGGLKVLLNFEARAKSFELRSRLFLGSVIVSTLCATSASSASSAVSAFLQYPPPSRKERRAGAE